MDDPAAGRVTVDIANGQPLQVQQPRHGRLDILGNTLHLRPLNQARDLDL